MHWRASRSAPLSVTGQVSLPTSESVTYRRQGVAASKNTPDKWLTRVRRAGFPSEFIRTALLPDWWDDACGSDPALAPEIEIRIARFLGVSLSDLATSSELQSPAYPNAQLKRMGRLKRGQLGPSIHAALRVAGAVLRSLKAPLPKPSVPPSALRWRDALASNGSVSLEDLVRDLWKRGVPVIHLEVLPTPRFQGLAAIVEGRPIVIIGHARDEPARLSMWLAHEAGHIAHGDCAEGAPVVDENDEADSSVSERRADAFAWAVLLGDAVMPSFKAKDFREVAQVASAISREKRVDPGVVVWAWANRTGDFKTGQMALKALYRDVGGARLLRAHFDAHVDVALASESDRGLLNCVHGADGRDATPG